MKLHYPSILLSGSVLDAHPVPVFLSAHLRTLGQPRGVDTIQDQELVTGTLCEGNMALPVPKVGLASMMKEGAKVRLYK